MGLVRKIFIGVSLTAGLSIGPWGLIEESRLRSKLEEIPGTAAEYTGFKYRELRVDISKVDEKNRYNAEEISGKLKYSHSMALGGLALAIMGLIGIERELRDRKKY